MFPNMIILTIETCFQNGRQKWRHLFTEKFLISENGYDNEDCADEWQGEVYLGTVKIFIKFMRFV